MCTSQLEIPQNQLVERSLGQHGQSVVEFLILISMIMIISMSFLRLINGNLADQWKVITEIILDDKSQTVQLR